MITGFSVRGEVQRKLGLFPASIGFIMTTQELLFDLLCDLTENATPEQLNKVMNYLQCIGEIEMMFHFVHVEMAKTKTPANA
tara:strand:- start:71 stop:316 length:246 start_codon:yes stop_codon:yes gene_type:complete